MVGAAKATQQHVKTQRNRRGQTTSGCECSYHEEPVLPALDRAHASEPLLMSRDQLCKRSERVSAVSMATRNQFGLLSLVPNGREHGITCLDHRHDGFKGKVPM